MIKDVRVILTCHICANIYEHSKSSFSQNKHIHEISPPLSGAKVDRKKMTWLPSSGMPLPDDPFGKSYTV